ncbi:MAG: hypothetical protein ABFS34_00350 [Gemmatimonadota bacterium]
MYGPQFVEEVRTLTRGSGAIAPTLEEAQETAGGASAWALPRSGSLPGLLVLRSPPLSWAKHPSVAGDARLVAALQIATDRPPMLLPLPAPGAPGPHTGNELIRQGVALALAGLWGHAGADDLERREIVGATLAANRVGRRLRALATDPA